MGEDRAVQVFLTSILMLALPLDTLLSQPIPSWLRSHTVLADSMALRMRVVCGWRDDLWLKDLLCTLEGQDLDPKHPHKSKT